MGLSIKNAEVERMARDTARRRGVSLTEALRQLLAEEEARIAAAREAQIVGINPSIHSGQVDAAAAQNGAAAETDQKSAWIKEAAGDRYDELEINMLQFAGIVTDDRRGVAETMAPLFGLPPSELDTYPHACIGSVEEIAESIRERRERWDVSYVVFQGDCREVLGLVLRGAGRNDEARAALEQALARYEAKGDLPSIARARERLAALG